MSSELAAMAAETDTTANDPAPLVSREMHGRTWRFGQPDVRPSRFQHYATLASAVEGKRDNDIPMQVKIDLSLICEEMLKMALPPADRTAFDTAPFSGSEIGELAAALFDALGVSAGESAASHHSSRATRRRSRPTSKRRTK